MASAGFGEVAAWGEHGRPDARNGGERVRGAGRQWVSVYRSAVQWTNARTWLGRRVLVTGASGFVGQAVCRVLLEAGAEVHGTWRRHRAADEVIQWPATLPADAAAVVARVDPEVVFHLAAPVNLGRDEELYDALRDGIVDATRAVAAACERSGARLVHVGTCDEVAGAQAPMNEDALVATTSPYGALKAAASEWVRMRGVCGDLQAVVLRPFRAYGPGGRSGLVPAACRAALRGQELGITDGLQVREWNHVDNIAAHVVAAGAHPDAPGQVLHLGGGPRLSVLHLARRIFECAGSDPDLVKPGALPRRLAEVDALFTDAHAALCLFGAPPAMTLEEGLQDTLEWTRHALSGGEA